MYVRVMRVCDVRSHAKHLIGDTIRRNASPVRLEGALDGGARAASRASLDSAGSDERPREVSSLTLRTSLYQKFTLFVNLYFTPIYLVPSSE